MDLEPHGSESWNQCVPEPLQVETKRGRETPRPRRRVWLKLPKRGILGKGGKTRLDLSVGAKERKKAHAQTFHQWLLPATHTHQELLPK